MCRVTPNPQRHGRRIGHKRPKPVALETKVVATTITPAQPISNAHAADTSSSTMPEKTRPLLPYPVVKEESPTLNAGIALFSTNVPGSWPKNWEFVPIHTMGYGYCEFAWILKSLLLADDEHNLRVLISAAYALSYTLLSASDETLQLLIDSDRMRLGGAGNQNPSLYYSMDPHSPADIRKESSLLLNNFMGFANNNNHVLRDETTASYALFLMGIILHGSDYGMCLQYTEAKVAAQCLTTHGRNIKRAAAAFKINGLHAPGHCTALIGRRLYDKVRNRGPGAKVTIPNIHPLTHAIFNKMALLAREATLDAKNACVAAIQECLPKGSAYRSSNAVSNDRPVPPLKPEVMAVPNLKPEVKDTDNDGLFRFQGRSKTALKKAEAADAQEAAVFSAALAASAAEAAEAAQAAPAPAKEAPKSGIPEAAPADADARSDSAEPDDAAAAALAAGALSPPRAPLRIAVLSPKFADLSDDVKSKIASLPVLRPGLNLGAAVAAARPPLAAPRMRLRSGSKS